MIEHIIHISVCSLRAKCGQGPNLERCVEVSKRRAIDSLEIDAIHLLTSADFNVLCVLIVHFHGDDMSPLFTFSYDYGFFSPFVAITVSYKVESRVPLVLGRACGRVEVSGHEYGDESATWLDG